MMNVKRIILAAVAVFLVGAAAGAGVGVVQAWQNEKNALPVASYGELQNKDKEQIDEFVKDQEEEHPDGLNEISVDGKYEQPEVDENGNLVKPDEDEEKEPNNEQKDKDADNKEENKKPAENTSETKTKTGVITVSESSSLRMRSGAGTEYEVIGGLYRGDKVTVLSEKNGWYEIKTENGIEAWVSAQYVEIQ